MKKNHYILFSVLLGLFYGIGGIFFQNQVYAASNKTTHVRLSIYNSYSGHITFSPSQNITNIGGTLRTTDTSLSIIVSATTGSSFTIAGDIVTPIVGNGIGSYHISESLVLSPNDGVKNIQTSFMKGTEPYTDNTSIIVDTTPPTQTNLLSPDNNNTITGDITLSRSESTDTGVGLSHYKVHLSVDPGFLSETVITSTENMLQVTANSMPIGILYRYVESIDLLGNHSTSISKLFHHTTAIIPPEPNENNSNGIGGGIPQPINNTGTIIENNTGDDNTTVTTGDIDNILTGSIHTGNNTPPLELTGDVHNVGGEDNTNTPIIEQKDSPIPNNSSSEDSFQNSQQKPYYQEAVSKGSNICNFLSYNEMCTAITNSTIYTEIVSTTPQTKDIINTLLVQYDNFIVTILGTTATYSENKTINMCKVLPENIIIQPYYEQESLLPMTVSITPILTGFSYIVQGIKHGLYLAFQIYKTL